MSEVTGTPPPAGTQPTGGQGEGPRHVTGSRTSTDGATAQDHQAPREQASPETEKARARFDPAVAVSPSLAHLEPGQELRGDIVRIDGEGRPVLETREAVYALEPDAGLRKDDRIAILIETVEKRAIGRLIEKAGERLEVQVRVSLTLVSLHQTPDARPEDAARQNVAAESYAAPSGHAGAMAAEFDFESSALALPVGGIPGHGAAPGPRAASTAPDAAPDSAPPAVADAATEAHGVSQGKKALATLTGTLLKVGEQSGEKLPAAPGATRIYAQTFGGENSATATGTPPGSTPRGSEAPGQPVVATPSLPQLPIDPLPMPSILQPGRQLAARLVAATEGAPARHGLGNLAAGANVTLTILAQGAEKAGLAQSQAFTGVITSAGEIAASARDVTGLGLAKEAGEGAPGAAPAAPEKTAPGGPEGIERRAAERTGPQSDRHYIKSPAGAFLFYAAEKIALGTRVTLTATPGLPEALQTADAPARATTATAATAKPAQNPAAQPAGAPSATATPASPVPASSPEALPPQPLPPLVSYQAAWPLVDEMIEAVTAAPASEQGAANALAPRVSAPGARLSSGLIFFLSALRLQNPRAWIGEQSARALEANGKTGLLTRLKEEFARLGRFSADTPGADWRPFLIPLQTEQGTQAIALLTRPHHEEGDAAPGQDGDGDDEDLTENQRFLLEVKLSALGPIQLDGLMRPERLDMVIRAGDMLTGTMRDDLRAIFESATGAAGLKGSLAFEPMDRSPVDVTRVLAEAQSHTLAGGHDARTLV